MFASRVAARRVGAVDPQAAAVAPVVRQALATPGCPLEPATLSEMSARLGHDFSTVRVHADEAAARAARRVDAAAFTVAEHVVFDAGRFDPGSRAGRRLLAHELAHVAQQRHASAVVAGVGAVEHPSEHAAERAAAGDARGLSLGAPVPALQRAPTGLPDKPASATIGGEELEFELTAFLQRTLAAQGGQRLRVTEAVKQGIRSLTIGDPSARLRVDLMLSDTAPTGTPAEFAKRVARALGPAVARAGVEKLRDATVSDAGPVAPSSAAEALGTVVERGVRPLVKWLPQKVQDAIVDAARSSVADGVVAAVQAALKTAPLDDQGKKAVVKAVEGIIKQRRATAAAPASDDRAVREQPASVEPARPSVKGEDITTSPSVKTPGTPGPPVIKAEPSALPPGLAAAVGELDSARLIPTGDDGKPATGSFADAKQFARVVYDALVEAQRNSRVAEVVLPGEYRPGLGMADVLAEAERIVRIVAVKAPGAASRVPQVTIRTRDYPNLRRIVRLHEAP